MACRSYQPIFCFLGRNTTIGLTVLLLSGIAVSANAGVTAKTTVQSYKHWSQGKSQSAFVTSQGSIRPGWETKRIAIPADGIWSAALAANGDAYIGTDHKGTVYRVRQNKVTKLATIPGVVAVVSMTVDVSGTIYAGTMPKAQVWRINPTTAKSTRVTTLAKAETVWTLAFDSAGRYLYAGTGAQGTLVRIDPKNGKSRVVLKTQDKRILTMAAGLDGSIWVGTSDKGLVFRYDPKTDSARAMADFDANEITSMAPYRGGVIVAANQLKGPSTSELKTRSAIHKLDKNKNKGQRAQPPKNGSTPGADPAAARTSPPRRGARKGQGTLFQVYDDGRLRQIHALTQTYYTSVLTTDGGRIFAGSAQKGRIYLIEQDDSAATAFDVKETMIAKLLYRKKYGLWFVTTDGSALFKNTGLANKAVYVSKVFDTKVPSRFGKLSWRSKGKLAVETRTGNTAEPEIGWSKWQKLSHIRKHSGGQRSGNIRSLPGRYLQFRVHLRSPDASVDQTSFYYLPQNLATRVQSISISRGLRNFVTTQQGPIKPRSPVVKLQWKIANPDSDKTEYLLHVRRDGEAFWRPIETGNKPLTKTSFDWNTETFPDGNYRLRVTASDHSANSIHRSLQHNKMTSLFVLDNGKPQITDLRIRKSRVSGRLRDKWTNIAEIAYSIDDAPWQIATTEDGILDSLDEHIRITLPKLPTGLHTFALRVADEAGNLGSVSTTFRVP